MSALTRDPLARDPLAEPARRAADLWRGLDRQELTPPSLPAGRPVRGAPAAAVRWPAGMPDRASWPPAPEGERPQPRPVVATPAAPEAFDDEAGWRAFAPLAEAAPLRPAGQDGYAGAPGGARSFRAGATTAVPFDWPRPAAAPIPAPVPGPASGPARGVAADARSGAWSGAWSIPVPADAPATVPHQPATRRDPSPSRLAYRLNRLWLTPAVRLFVRLGLPLIVLAALTGGWAAQQDNRAALAAWAAGVIEAVQNQPMFQVSGIEVIAETPEVGQGVEHLLGLRFPVSSWQLDPAALRARAEELDAVEGAWVQVRSGGVLEVRVRERVPAMIWRNAGGLDLVDAEGHRVARLATRAARADLPLIAGDGAPAAIAEAQTLWAAAAPLHGRIRGLVRVGQRRWDVVLDRDQRILLPATGALEALERVVAMTEGAQQLLSRDVLTVDMRNPARPTLRLTPEALAELNRNRSQARGANRR